MIRLICALGLVCLPLLAGADTDTNTDTTKDPGASTPPVIRIISREDLRDAIYARDFDRVETELANMQARYREGHINPGYARELFTDFGSTHPDIIAFTKDWVAQMPDSAFAHTARAWSLHRQGWLMRGMRWARETYPDALDQHAHLHAEGADHARRAYDLDPTLLQASDAVLLFGNSGGLKSRAFVVLDEMMQRDPNWGTLKRALLLTHTGWGGSYDMAEKMCADYGPMLDKPVDDMRRYCRLHAILNYHLRGRRPMFDALLAQEDDPSLDWMRVQIARLDRFKTRDQAELVYRVLHDTKGTDIELAEQFDMFAAGRYDLDLLQGEVTRNAKDHVRKNLRHDPFDPWMIDVQTTWEHDFTKTENGGVHARVLWRPTYADLADAAKRHLAMSPYRPEYWKDLGDALHGASTQAKFDDGDLLAADPYLINAVVYSNHGKSELLDYITMKFNQIWWLDNDASRDGIRVFATSRAGIDMDRDIVCPLLRAGRILSELNRYSGHSDTSGLEPDQALWMTTHRDDAAARGACLHERDGPIDTLIYLPVALDIGVETPAPGH